MLVLTWNYAFLHAFLYNEAVLAHFSLTIFLVYGIK